MTVISAYAQDGFGETGRAFRDRIAVNEDKFLVDRMLRGDAHAFDEFADTYAPALYRFAIRRLDGDRELTRDIVQTSLCKALSKIDTFRGDAALFSWLCSVCRNEIAMHFRSRSSAPSEDQLDEENVTPIAGWRGKPGGPEEALLEAEAASFVHLALDLLQPDYAQALEWKYLDKLSVAEIGQRLDVGTKAAESVLSRARQAFKSGYGRLVDEMSSSGSKR